jgi:hypothetical protein
MLLLTITVIRKITKLNRQKRGHCKFDNAYNYISIIFCCLAVGGQRINLNH